MATVDGRGARAARWLVAGRGPLKRGTDRVEMVFRMFLMVALLVATPIGSLISATVYQQENAVASRQAQDRHRVHAEVLVQPPAAVASDAVVQARFGWTDPHGAQRTADVAVLATTRLHDKVTLWTTPDGRLAVPPLDHRDVTATAAWAGIFGGLLIVLLAWAQLALVRLLLNGRRARQWETEWLAIEPLWTARGR